MFFAEHLTVIYVCLAAFAPWRYVVGFHFFQLIMRFLSMLGNTMRTNSVLTFIYLPFFIIGKSAE